MLLADRRPVIDNTAMTPVHRKQSRRPLLLLVAAILLPAALACSGDSPSPATQTPQEPTAAAPTATPTSVLPATATASPPPPTLTPAPAPRLEALGMPLAPETITGIVRGQPPSRTVEWDRGPAAAEFSRRDQPAADPVVANSAGWNCRTHQEYEGQPAVDWYIPEGTPVLSTMDGTARLLVITTSNPFDVYGVSREPYLGNPDRDRAPLSPFPGVGGGKGIFVRVENSGFVTEYAHLSLETFLSVPSGATFAAGYGPANDYAAMFGALRGFQEFTEIASWPVRAGDVIGLSGDTGYSEAPHLHYTLRRAGGPLLCPTTEAAFADNGWLFR